MKTKSYILPLILSLGLTGCAVTLNEMEGPPAAMRIEEKEAKVLLGDYKYLKIIVRGDDILATAQLNVTDGDLSCSGQVDYNEKTQKIVRLPIDCSDGRSGVIIVTFSRTTWRSDQRGIGVGNLNDSTKIRLILGNMNGSLAW